MTTMLRTVVRSLIRSPRFTLMAVVPLALTIGATTTLFSLVEGVLLRPLPFRTPDRIVRVLRVTAEGVVPSHSGPNLLELAGRQSTLTSLSAFWEGEAVVAADQGSGPLAVGTAQVGRDFFSTLAALPALGRFFEAHENEPGQDDVVVLSHGLRERLFGEDGDVVGRTIRVDGRPSRIVGVAEEGFAYPAGAVLWQPLPYGPRIRDDRYRGGNFLELVGRLEPASSPEAAEKDLAAIFADIDARYPGSGALMVVSLRDHLLGAVDRPLRLLLVAVVFVLMIASANVANLLLGRGSTRRVELSVRKALGAGNLQIVGLLLMEGAVLAALAATAGAGVAALAVSAAPRLAPLRIPGVAGLSVDGSVLAMSALGCAAVVVAFATAPALLAARTAPARALGAGGRSSAGHGGLLRRSLVATEVALSLTLLAAAGMTLESFARLSSVDAGMEAEDLVAADVPLRQERYRTPGATEELVDRLERALRARPGAKEVAITSGLPLEGPGNRMGFEIAGRPPLDPGAAPLLTVRAVSPRYFASLGIPLLAGVPFSEADVAGAPPVAILSASAQRRFFAGENAIGQEVVLARMGVTARIVGVAGDVHATSLALAPEPHIYLPLAQFPLPRVTVLFADRTGELESATSQLRAVLREVDPELALANPRRVDDVRRAALARPRAVAGLLTGAATLAVLLSVTGIFSVVASEISSRRRELGIRAALGAAPAAVVRELTIPTLRLIAAGGVVGILGAVAVGRFSEAFLFGVEALDISALTSAVALLLLTGVLATVIPAVGVARTPPGRLVGDD